MMYWIISLACGIAVMATVSALTIVIILSVAGSREGIVNCIRRGVGRVQIGRGALYRAGNEQLRTRVGATNGGTNG
jgi:hypothetical protein